MNIFKTVAKYHLRSLCRPAFTYRRDGRSKGRLRQRRQENFLFVYKFCSRVICIIRVESYMYSTRHCGTLFIHSKARSETFQPQALILFQTLALATRKSVGSLQVIVKNFLYHCRYSVKFCGCLRSMQKQMSQTLIIKPRQRCGYRALFKLKPLICKFVCFILD